MWHIWQKWCLILVSKQERPLSPTLSGLYMDELETHLNEIDKDFFCLFNMWSHSPLRWRRYLEFCAHKIFSILSSSINAISKGLCDILKNLGRISMLTFYNICMLHPILETWNDNLSRSQLPSRWTIPDWSAR